MLAYSSIEHMGIIALGMGIGGAVGTFGALLHMFNHSMAKSLLFFASGNIMQQYHSKRIDRIGGIIRSQPVTASLFFMGILAVIGLPPFSLFISEWMIMLEGFRKGYLWQTAAFLVLAGIIFVGLVYYSLKLVFGEKPAKVASGETSLWSTVPLFLPLALLLLFGLYVPGVIRELLQVMIRDFAGGM